MSGVFVCLFICLTTLLKIRLVKLLAGWYNFACNMKWLSIPVSETDLQIFIASFCFGKNCVKNNKIAKPLNAMEELQKS